MKLSAVTKTVLTYKHPKYSTFLQVGLDSSYINMVICGEKVSTNEDPLTHKLLAEYAPDVLFSHCFNDECLPFTKEVVNTELAHLFEHIFIQKLAMLRKEIGGMAQYDGETIWDWDKEPYGTFHININCSMCDTDIIEEAFDFAVGVFNRIIESK